MPCSISPPYWTTRTSRSRCATGHREVGTSVVVTRQAPAGDGSVVTVSEVKLWDKVRALELAATYLGLLKKQVEHSGEIDLVKRLQAAKAARQGRIGRRRGPLCARWRDDRQQQARSHDGRRDVQPATARTYTRVMVAGGYRAEQVEAYRLTQTASMWKEVAKHCRAIETGECQDARQYPVSRAFDLRCHAAFLAEGKYALWIHRGPARIAQLEPAGTITVDRDRWNRYDVSDAQAGAPSWQIVAGAGGWIWR